MVPLEGKIDPTDLIPPSSVIARYSGSLTTPTCTERPRAGSPPFG